MTRAAISPDNKRVQLSGLSIASCRRHREALVVASVIVIGSFVLTAYPNGRVGLVGQPALLLPPLCWAQQWFGISCPGCGLTRSFIYLAHGDFEASWQVHRLGWLVAALVVVQFPYRLYSLY